eukprot:CAMPEP_0175907906 /NCGR_PEP_ID=MMETSP0108-20121206/6311_1 /TAXON_ID=195067 ORGANISM="Goniomonas pacifica, Strain CCMP1869" /NCGR_SAMPLE_ID=MMETSP0108 /ASSEMBLY_ACC=CAM_ASM_000204 /LENGTH=73 /DNA_ID=CAMNT_0017229919 /DNA_START=606 /DNA_END=827 /DNA_ORIENTATION=+
MTAKARWKSWKPLSCKTGLWGEGERIMGPTPTNRSRRFSPSALMVPRQLSWCPGLCDGELARIPPTVLEWLEE